MFFKKKGIPEEGDIVLCTVKKILYHSIFVDLDEYENQEAMIHISEIAPGRIRNIRDYVSEGRKLVCKVLRINLELKHVDLSLRRVSLGARKKKNEEIKQELKAEKMLESLAIKVKEKKEKVFKEIGSVILEEYENIFFAFQEVVSRGDEVLTELNIPTKYIVPLTEIIKERIKPPQVIVEGTLILTSPTNKGIEDVKKAIIEALKLVNTKKSEVDIAYLGAPIYKIEVKAPDYKIAEAEMEKIVSKIISSIEKSGGSGVYNKK
jgi:translation initiation factor 2 subunit 1